jgi:hypothetical protein
MLNYIRVLFVAAPLLFWRRKARVFAGEGACGPQTLKEAQPRAAVPHEYRQGHRQECLCHMKSESAGEGFSTQSSQNRA